MEQPQFGPERPVETTYMWQGRPTPPRRVCELQTVKNYSNGIGLATVGYIAAASASGSLLLLLAAVLSPEVYIRGPQFYAPAYVTQLIYIASYVLSLVLPFSIYAAAIKIPLRVALPFRRADPGVTFGGAAVGMELCCVAGWCVNLLQYALGSVGVTITLPQIDTPTDPLAYCLYALLVAVLPAIFEESVFRGVLMQSLRRFGDGFALVMSALLFGLYHLNFVQMPYAIMLGLCLGYFTLRTGSLWCAVLIHLVNNSQSLLIDYVASSSGDRAALMVSDSLSILWLVLGGFALCLLMLRDQNLFMLNPPPCSLSVKEKVSAFLTTPMFVVAIIVCALFMLNYISFGGSTVYAAVTG